MPERVNPVLKPLAEWLASCANKGEVSRNTVAVGIVVLDHLREKVPLEKSDVLSPRGEVKGARSGLAQILEKYGIPAKYLKEVTTRAGHQDGQRLLEAFDYGATLTALPPEQREEDLHAAIASLVVRAQEWLGRQHFKLNLDRQYSPSAWIAALLDEARSRSGGKVEQHLVGAKLEERHPDVVVSNFSGHAADAQTGRDGDFIVGSTCYHVTAAPGSGVIRKCAANLAAGLHPVLLAPRDQVVKARNLAEDQEVASRVTIIAIEDFIALNVIEMSKGNQQVFVSVLKAIVERYNRRLGEVESDLSLKIEIQ